MEMIAGFILERFERITVRQEQRCYHCFELINLDDPDSYHHDEHSGNCYHLFPCWHGPIEYLID
jgi:hypothetical protein